MNLDVGHNIAEVSGFTWFVYGSFVNKAFPSRNYAVIKSNPINSYGYKTKLRCEQLIIFAQYFWYGSTHCVSSNSCQVNYRENRAGSHSLFLS